MPPFCLEGQEGQVPLACADSHRTVSSAGLCGLPVSLLSQCNVLPLRRHPVCPLCSQHSCPVWEWGAAGLAPGGPSTALGIIPLSPSRFAATATSPWFGAVIPYLNLPPLLLYSILFKIKGIFFRLLEESISGSTSSESHHCFFKTID